MLCYKDMTFCGSKVHKPDCKRALTPEIIKAAEKWWGSDDAPIAAAYFCDEPEDKKDE